MINENASNEMDALNKIWHCLKSIACSLSGDAENELTAPVTIIPSGAGTLPATFGWIVSNFSGSDRSFNGQIIKTGTTEQIFSLVPFAAGIAYDGTGGSLRITYFPVS